MFLHTASGGEGVEGSGANTVTVGNKEADVGVVDVEGALTVVLEVLLLGMAVVVRVVRLLLLDVVDVGHVPLAGTLILRAHVVALERH